MAMTVRVARLRQHSLEARPTLSTERAELLTRFYQQDLGLLSIPMQRALLGDYFCNLGRALQDEIIARTEQQGF